MSILKLLGFISPDSKTRPTSETNTIRKITGALDRMDPKQATYVAAFSYILSRVANADLDISYEESQEMERIVMEQGGLPKEQAILVVQIAKTQALLFGGTEDYLVTRKFNTISSRSQKLALLHCLFSVSSADKSISTSEDSAIRQIASELKLDHKDFIAVRRAHRDHLAVLQSPPKDCS